MYPDVADLREFYDGELGGFARRLIRAALRRLWENVAGFSVLGLGYATPYLRPMLGEAARLFAFMPAPQGVTWWPREGPNATALTEETTLPLAENSIDRILLVHALENTQHLKALLEESWRVLAGNGRMVVVVPHRGGFWNMSSKIPFGSGFSFSHGHIRRLLADNRFQVERHARALFVPPFLYRLLGPSAEWIERNGARFLPALA
ncbi:MAG: methyltransferase domain-containing protein, partial [Proteobacteria bacterium]|nr:methyltransferase domain-containing protein [Pseudomonadota bacterium]